MLLKCPCHHTYLVQHIYLLQTFVLNPRIHFLKAWDLWKMEMTSFFIFLTWGGGGCSFCINPCNSFRFHHLHRPGELGSYKVRDSHSSDSACTESIVWPLRHSVPAPFQNLRALRILSTVRKSSLSHEQTEKTPGAFPEWRSSVRGDQGPSRSKTCTISSKAYDAFCYFHPNSVKKSDISYFQRNLWGQVSHLSSSTLQSQTPLYYFKTQTHQFAPLLLSPRLPYTRVDMQRFGFLFRTHVFPGWLYNTTRLQRANLCLCQELHLHKRLCHAPDAGWVKSGRNPQHAHIYLSCSWFTGTIQCHP